MFERLKTKNLKQSKFVNRPHPRTSANLSPGTSSAPIKGNEKDRLVRCRHCGFICDRERDVRLPDGTWAGFGINQGSQLTAGSSPKSDARIPAAGNVEQTPDKYYAREVVGGCPCCGSYLYDPKMSITYIP